MKIQPPLSIILSLYVAFSLTPVPAMGQDVTTPGPEHDTLKKMEEVAAKIKMGDDESEGAITYKMDLGGLWLLSEFRADFGGQKYQGRGMDSYDPQKKKYVSVWADSWTPRPTLFEGSFDKEKKTMTMVGEALGPDGKMAKHKMVTHMPDNNHQTFTMYIVGPDGQEAKMMTIQYTRKK